MDFEKCEECFGCSMNDCWICPIYQKWLIEQLEKETYNEE